MIYLASPYWHPDPLIRAKRVDISLQWLVRHAMRWERDRTLKPMIAPLTYTLSIKPYLGKWDNPTWIALTDALLRHCSEMHILELPGWKKSKGVRSEITTAVDLEIPITHIPFDAVHDRLVREAERLLMLHENVDG